MFRGPKKWTEELLERWQREGRGKGDGREYKPWIEVAEVPSLGRSRRPFGIITGRQHQLLSDVEWNLFLFIEWSRGVVDIREQFPLDRDLTLEIAAGLGIRHPHYPGTHVPAVMTTDFLVTRIRNGEKSLEAWDAKRSEEAEDAESIERLQIHRAYFSGMQIPHRLVFHSFLPMAKARNLAWLRDAYLKEGEVEPIPGFFEDHGKRMSRELAHSTPNLSLSEYCSRYDSRHALEPGAGLRIARLLMHQRILMADLASPNLAGAPLASFQITAHPGQLRIVRAA